MAWIILVKYRLLRFYRDYREMCESAALRHFHAFLWVFSERKVLYYPKNKNNRRSARETFNQDKAAITLL
jgi:hypothetical protein